MEEQPVVLATEWSVYHLNKTKHTYKKNKQLVMDHEDV